jgi:hypothetical protein
MFILVVTTAIVAFISILSTVVIVKVLFATRAKARKAHTQWNAYTDSLILRHDKHVKELEIAIQQARYEGRVEMMELSAAMASLGIKAQRVKGATVWGTDESHYLASIDNTGKIKATVLRGMNTYALEDVSVKRATKAAEQLIAVARCAGYLDVETDE